MAVVLSLLVNGNAIAGRLPIMPIQQQEANWCWLASMEMVLRYLGVPSVNPASYQCGEIAVIVGGPCALNCRLCNLGSQTASNIATGLVKYTQLAGGPHVSASLALRPLNPQEVQTEINQGLPIIVGVSPHSHLPPGLNASEHAVVIVGYDVPNQNTLIVIVNDPYPYQQGQNPWQYAGAALLAPGQYAIPYQNLIQSMAWNTSILVH